MGWFGAKISRPKSFMTSAPVVLLHGGATYVRPEPDALISSAPEHQQGRAGSCCPGVRSTACPGNNVIKLRWDWGQVSVPDIFFMLVITFARKVATLTVGRTRDLYFKTLLTHNLQKIDNCHKQLVSSTVSHKHIPFFTNTH
jgi:hypothetical protein